MAQIIDRVGDSKKHSPEVSTDSSSGKEPWAVVGEKKWNARVGVARDKETKKKSAQAANTEV